MLQCGVQNFRRRDQCFKCGGPKAEPELEGSDEISPTPTTSKFNNKTPAAIAQWYNYRLIILS